MKLLKEMPKSGQFVAVWEHNGRSWGRTFAWSSGELFLIGNDTGWERTSPESYQSVFKKATFFTTA